MQQFRLGNIRIWISLAFTVSYINLDWKILTLRLQVTKGFDLGVVSFMWLLNFRDRSIIAYVYVPSFEVRVQILTTVYLISDLEI